MATKNVPQLRFKGFTEEWEEKEYAATFLPLNNNTLSRAELNYEEGSTKNVHYGDVLIKFGECLDVLKEELPYINDEKIADKFSLLEEGDIVIADAAEDETVGKCTELLNVLGERVVAGLHTIACRPLFLFANRYLGYFLNAPIFHNQLLPLMQGTKVLSISKTAIKNTVIYYPEFDEQKQIGEFFQNIDTLINANQNKLDKLKNIKKACLEKMFPRRGATTPEIRFKGFSGEWEEKKIKDLCSITTGNSNTQDQTPEGKYPFYIRSDKAVRSDKYLYDCEAVLTIGDGNIGKVFHYVNGKFDLHQRVYKMADFKNIDGKYFFYYFSSMFYERAMMMTAKATVDSVRLEMISEMDIYKPELLKEQVAIAAFFTQIDNLISKNEQQLDKLKNIKKACLEKMFVNKEDAI